jgi:hypothetical protein
VILKFAELSAIEFPAGHCMHAMRHASAQTSHSRDDPGRRCGLVVLAMLLMVVAESEVSAQTRGPRDDVDTGGLTVEAVAGWDGTVDQSMPVPISLLLSNYSGRDLDGTRTLTNPASGDRLSLGKVYISQAGTRTFTSIQALPDWYECYVSLSEAGQLIWRRELPISTGKTFDPTTNFALLIEDSDRRLQLPRVGRAASGSSEWVNNDTGVAGSGGRRVDCLTAKPWQIPKHPGPLTAVQAVVFPEEVADDILNEVQWQAVARWMCQGGGQSSSIRTRMRWSVNSSTPALWKWGNHRVGAGSKFVGPASGPSMSTRRLCLTPTAVTFESRSLRFWQRCRDSMPAV